MRIKLTLGVCAFALSACCSLPLIGATPQEFQIRLLTPLASYTKAGTHFEAKVIGATSSPKRLGFPPGTRIFGTVVRARATGLGFRRERALLDIEFNRCELPTGESIACDVTLTSVDNAREHVRNGQIRGILAASHPNSWLSGVWYRPDVERIPHSLLGLTGAGGMIYTRFMPTPIGAAVMIGSHLLLFRMPEPEIELPSGTDLLVQIDGGLSPSQIISQPEVSAGFSDELVDYLTSLPPRVTKAGAVAALDLVNVALMGDRGQVSKAFEDAGWSGTSMRNARTLVRTYSAYAAMKSYASAPVSPLFYDGRLPDLVFQKSFNTLARRHHVRLWAVDTPEGSGWIGAATHDTSITFNARRMSLEHRIDPLIDREKNMLINDLSAAGCVSSMQFVERPELLRRSGTADTAITSGALTVAGLQSCTQPVEAAVAPLQPRRSIGALVVRQVVLDTRNYVTRGNAYYWLYSGLRRMHSSRKTGDDSDDGDLPLDTQSLAETMAQDAPSIAVPDFENTFVDQTPDIF